MTQFLLFEFYCGGRDWPAMQTASARRLDLEFEDGRSLRVRFDQGIAYWQVRFGSHADMWFDFDLEAQDQLMHMAKVVETAKVQNSEQKWSTDVLVELRRI